MEIELAPVVIVVVEFLNLIHAMKIIKQNYLRVLGSRSSYL